MKNFLPISVIICALNEENRIKDAILSARSNNPAEIIVIEGGSTDDTFIIAEQYADKVFQVNPFNLGYKRNYGVIKASQPYILIMDADQVIEAPQLDIMLNDLLSSDWVGIQSQLKSLINSNYWERAMEATLNLSHGKPGETNMIGTPALYIKDALIKENFNPSITGSCDDTDLCYRLHRKGYKFGISHAVCYQKHRSNLGDVYRKFYWYGEGDAQFARLHPERLFNIFLHPIKNYMFKKAWALFIRGNIKYAFFPFFVGFIRHCGFWRGTINSFLRHASDSRLANRHNKEGF